MIFGRDNDARDRRLSCSGDSPVPSVRAVCSRVRLAVLAACAVALCALPTARGALAQEPAERPLERIAGRVVQGTKGVELPAGLQVTLTVLDGEGNVVAELPQTVNADGAFSFADLPGDTASPGRYTISMTYGEIRSTVRLAEVDDPEIIELLVFEPTGSTGVFSVLTHATMIEPGDVDSGLLTISELVDLANTGDRTFVPDVSSVPDGVPRLLTFDLPEGYQELSVESNLPPNAFVKLDRGFGLFAPVPPGRYRLLFGYTVPHADEELVFVRRFPYGAEQVRFLMADGMGTVSGHGLVPGENALIGDNSYRVMQGSDYPKGAEVTIRLSLLASPSVAGAADDAAGGTAWMIIAIPAVAGVAMAVLLGHAIHTQSRRGSVTMVSPDRQDTLVAEIAELDNRFEVGTLGEQEYRRLRTQLVGRALGRSQHQ